jgi:hypothetical protein
MAVYFATKAYVLSFTEALHEELKPHGIHVTALCPGPTRTEFGEVAGFKTHGAFEKLGMESAPVVRAGLKGLERNRAVVITGLLNKIVAQSTRFAPRSVVRRIAGSRLGAHRVARHAATERNTSVSTMIATATPASPLRARCERTKVLLHETDRDAARRERAETRTGAG